MGREKRTLKEIQRAYERTKRGIYDANANTVNLNILFRSLLEDIGYVSRSVRKGDFLKDMLPTLLVRLIDIWNKSDINVDEAVWHKYPGACPYCLSKKDCSCIKMGTKSGIDEAEVDKLRVERARAPQTLQDFQKMFKRIFGKTNDSFSIEYIWLHFVEECGELSKELRGGNIRSAIEETGDVFAGLVAMANKLNIDLEKEIEIKSRSNPAISFVGFFDCFAYMLHCTLRNGRTLMYNFQNKNIV